MPEPVCKCLVCKCRRKPSDPPFEICAECFSGRHAPTKQETLTAFLVDRFRWSTSFAANVEQAVNEWVDMRKPSKK